MYYRGMRLGNYGFAQLIMRSDTFRKDDADERVYNRRRQRHPLPPFVIPGDHRAAYVGAETAKEQVVLSK